MLHTTFFGTGLIKVPLTYLIIAGGGSGGVGASATYIGEPAPWYSQGGGGAAGGFITDTTVFAYGKSFTITVGPGGNGSNGGNSILTNGDWFTATALGGGKGGNGQSNGSNGGSGGGAGGGVNKNTYGGSPLQPSQTGYSTGFGYTGGNGEYHTYSTGYAFSGGGAGAGGNGGAGNDVNKGGSPGSGRSSSITGSAVTYAKGGDGDVLGISSTGYGTGGRAGGYNYSGGASVVSPQNGIGGIVILRSPIQAKSYTGSPSVTVIGGEYVYSFTSNGTITF